MPEPEKVCASSKPEDAGVKSQLYKSLLNQQVQKLWKQLPLYQTINEGFDHQPKFRTTVWVNGVGFTSPNTFQLRKMAEMDASKITYFAMMHKLRIEASHLVHENKSFCKSILVEYAARMKIQQPTYHTIRLDPAVPIFRSSLVFNDESWTGDDSKNKKEAEQSAARAAILKYLDSESGNIMSEIIKVKFKYYDEVKSIQSADNRTNVVLQTGSDNGLTLNEAKSEEGTKIPDTSALPEPCLVQDATIHATHLPVDVVQTHIPQVPISAPTPVVPVPTVLAQTTFAETEVAPTFSVLSAPPVGHFASTPATNTSTSVVHAEKSEASFVIAAPPRQLPSPALAQAECVNLNSSKKRNRKNKKNAKKKMPDTFAPPEPCLVQDATIPATHLPVDVVQTHIPQVPISAPTPVVPVPTVLAQTTFAGTEVAPTFSVLSSPSSGHFASIPATHTSNVVHPEKLEASFVIDVPPPQLTSPSFAQATYVNLNSSKKRNRKNKKNAKKKMRVENQSPLPAIALSQVPAFTAQ